MTLAWTPGNASKIWVDGKELDAVRISAGGVIGEIRSKDTTWTIMSSSDGIWASDGGFTVGIARDAQSSTVKVTHMPTLPRRYVDYSEMIAERQVFSGTCEGLF